MVLRCRAIGIFLAGAVVGFGVAQGRAPSSAQAGAVTVPRSEVQLVNGREESTPHPAGNAARPVVAPSLQEAGTPSRRAARAALPITVLITGDGVYGAGFFVGPNHVLTCWHVVEKMKSIHLSVPAGPEQTARVVDSDPSLDLAVLEIDAAQQAHPQLRSVTSLELGDAAFSMGAPRRMGFSLSSGIVSYVGRSYDGVLYLQTDIPTNNGSSGGPVLDAEGRVIGISSFILRDSQGLAFALPIDYAVERFAKYFAERLDSAEFDAWKAERAPAVAKLAARPAARPLSP
jgi:S1-C subfamily serine protease